MNVIKLSENLPEDKIGVILTDANCIATFNNLLFPILTEIHGFEIDSNNNEKNFNGKSF